MTGTEKLGRTAWVTYLITAAPVALFCAGMTLVWIRFLFVEDVGPIEEPPMPTAQKIIFLCSMISVPIAWTLGFAIAYRFNGMMLRMIPFIANILPMSGLLGLASILTRDEGGEFIWMAAYTGVLLALLAIGMIAALVSVRQKPQTPNKMSILTPDL